MSGHIKRLFKIMELVSLTLILYFICRLTFLFWNWNLFKTKSISDLLWAFIIGLRFDLSAILAITAPILLFTLVPWPQKLQKSWQYFVWVIYCLIQIPFLLLNLVDVEFINFVGRRFTFETLFILAESKGKLNGFLSTYWFFFIFAVAITSILIWISKKILLKNESNQWPPKAASKSKYWIQYAAVSFIILTGSVLGIRGGLQLKPISFVNANVFTVPMLNNLVLNSTFTVIKSYGKSSIKKEKYFSNSEELLKNLNGSLKGSQLEGHRPASPQNIVILILESFGEEYIGPYNGKTYTPFLDSLMKKSLVFKNGYANGRRSIEGIAAILGGVPALMNEPFISSNFSTNYFLGLGTLLSPLNYTTAFFHGGHNGTMHFDSFMKSAGINKYYGSNEYNNSEDDDGTWGIWDEPFLQFTAQKIDEMPQPFLTSIFTISSHHPFVVPEKYKTQFPEGPIDILKTISYTDMALKKFFETAEKKPWFKDTLFIVTADHTSKHFRPEYENEIGDYKIPLFFYHPSFKFPEIDTHMIVQHIDILPTVLDFIGIPNKEMNYLGSSVFVPGDKNVVNYIDGRYFIFTETFNLKWTPGHTDPEIFYSDLAKSNSVDSKSLSGTLKDIKPKLENKLKASIQYFNEGMWDNKLYYPTLGR